jgi:hypothetical protein
MVKLSMIALVAMSGTAFAGAGGTFGPPGDIAIPEPATLALLAGGAVAIALIRRRR